ncbi:YesL family protein [Alkalihalobacillus sp. LMS39]|uniref:YesL family protein n=1 Tax=Alkalihalobacillus sp. LMS39 TaxID=2924032 RepID=UPI001FB46F72|nr:YesL family protein [Alkalihalobacillus sp. LMS39]UOE95405.1 YesL family protein [Alkalihalobacillus sp. LMS39]
MLRQGSFLYQLCEWIVRLAYLNLLWVFFSLLGLVIFGVMPATVATYTVIRKWLRGEVDIPILSTFFQTVKQEFLKANAFGFVLGTIAFIIYFDFVLLQQVQGAIQSFIFASLLILVLLVSIMGVFLFPVYVHYKFSFFRYFQKAVLFGFISPLYTLTILFSLVAVYYVFAYIPGIFIFFGASLPAFIIMFLTHRVFLNVENRK